MTNNLSDWAREFLREDRVAVISTLNKDGSPQVTTIWYLLQEDGTFIMSTPGRTQKVQNLRSDPLCWLLGLSVRKLASFLVETGEMRVQSRRFLLNFFSGDTPFFTKESFYWCFVFSCA
jgi:predicted pyridoxine 5'-phosphate oxidase superfamily flavin-nucleotide-binding protein